jgi:hypothetical protein
VDSLVTDTLRPSRTERLDRLPLLLFTVFAGCFAVASAATWGLPERRGDVLEERPVPATDGRPG